MVRRTTTTRGIAMRWPPDSMPIVAAIFLVIDGYWD
uniref:Uncharacterized protein n=1 Tax=Siphoviridae sp. ct6d71 TaxID=2826298 RepID=A0A8S5R3B8_9CAUD|nr:MAG TPA: hypothetical protein [Siphoviridae sp. ct6d71]